MGDTFQNWWQDRAQRAYLAVYGEDDIWLPHTTDVRREDAETATPVASEPQPVANSRQPITASSRGTRVPPVATARNDSDQSRNLQTARKKIGDCRLCKLCETRTNIVFGEGDPQARLMFVGEGPGAQEDESGRPFVGRAGKLLTDIIEKGIRFAREEVYIANIVKCRPPGNRDPEEEEVRACMPFLREQIAVVKPEVIIVLGRPAVKALLGYEGPMGKIRGVWQEFDSIPVMPTWHPSYLLRSPGHKGETWEDIQQVMSRLGLK